MSSQILDGLALSRVVREQVKQRVDALLEKGIHPRLDVLVASQDPSSIAYVKMKRSWCAKAGIESRSYEVDATWSQEQLIAKVHELNADQNVHGVLIQHPLPPHLNESEALMALGPEKDVDGITPQSLGRLVAGVDAFHCATPMGIMTLLRHYEIPLKGKHAVVIGRSVILGKPAALLLLAADATVTIAHSRTVDLPDLVRTADIVVAAVGRPEMVRGEWLKPGAVIVDAGYNKVEGRDKDVGDVHFDSAKDVARWITPVPGGVGPMTVASLLSNCVTAAERR